MASSSHEQTKRWVTKERLGFWIGLALFVFVLTRPQADGMESAARSVVRAEARKQIAQRLQREGVDRSAASYPEQLERALAASSEHIEREARRRATLMVPAAAVTLLVALWWMTEAIPIPVTSLLPLLLFPLVGVLQIDEAAIPYARKSIFLYLGGFIIALGIERWNLHRRIALHVVYRIGTSQRRIVLAFMIATGGLSMWISNTATTLMMLPIALAVLGAIERTETESRSTVRQSAFGAALMLAICYSASIGGVASPIGTPTNIAFLGQFEAMFPNAPPITFAKWVVSLLPLSAIFLVVAWWILTRVTNRVPSGSDEVHRRVIADEVAKLEPITGPERWMVGVGLTTALLWMTRGSVAHENYGWAMLITRLVPDWLPADRADAYIDDTTVALTMAGLLFIIPGGRDEQGRRMPLMNWETAVRLPWGILLLFGGGFTIAHAFQYTGLSGWIGQALAGTGLSHPLSWVLGAGGLMTLLTEITSNTATTQVMLPVLKETAERVGLNPLMLMLPATIASSCAFMLPVATPPNAIVFASGRISMGRMVKCGIVVNLAGIVLVTAVFWFWVTWVLGIDPNTVPDWAAPGS